jgi:hypothetical protein
MGPLTWPGLIQYVAPAIKEQGARPDLREGPVTVGFNILRQLRSPRFENKEITADLDFSPLYSLDESISTILATISILISVSDSRGTRRHGRASGP